MMKLVFQGLGLKRFVRTIYQDILLVPVEEFLKKAPDDLTLHSDPHQQMLNRLEFEYIERKRFE
jgi:hypothetical protein